MNHQIIRNFGDKILFPMVENGFIKHRDIDILWKSSLAQYSDITKEFYKIFEMMARTLKDTDVCLLFDSLSIFSVF